MLLQLNHEKHTPKRYTVAQYIKLKSTQTLNPYRSIVVYYSNIYMYLNLKEPCGRLLIARWHDRTDEATHLN